MAFRTQKISQMTPKGANLEATDLIEVSTIESGSYVTRSITGQEIIDAAVGNVDWGDIGGTLSNQTDLQNALDAKQDDITLTTTGSSGASTLVGSTLNVPNYTLSGLGGVPTSRTLTINGVTQDLSANRTFTISTGITIGSTAIASGTVGRILFEGAGNVVQESANLFWDNTGFLAIGTNTPVAPSGYNGITINSASAGSYIWFQTGGVTKYTIGSESNVNYHNLIAGTSFLIRSGSSSYFNVVQSTGNIQIGTTTDAGFRLDVNGTARVQGNAQFGTGFYWDNTNNRLGIGTSSPSYLLHAIRNTPLGAELCIENINTGINASSNFRFITNAGFTSIGMNGSNDTGVGSNRIYMYSGTGSSGISLRASQSTNDITMYTGGDTASNLRMRIFSTGNVGINTTTDAGFRLDVNGTARVQNTLTLGGEIFGTTNTYFNGPSLNTGTLWLRFNAVNSNGNFTVTGPIQGTNVIASGNNSQLSSTGAGVQGVVISNTATSTNWRIEGHRTTSGALEFKNDLTNPVLNLFSSRNVGIGTFTDIASAKLIIESTTQGFLPPRMTTTQKNAIASPTGGLIVFDTSLNKLCVYTTSWETVTSL